MVTESEVKGDIFSECELRGFGNHRRNGRCNTGQPCGPAQRAEDNRKGCQRRPGAG